MENNNLSKFLGRFGDNGAIIKHPAKFVGGTAYIHQNRPAKTRVPVGDAGYFYLLPIGIGSLKSEIHEKFVEAAKSLAAPRAKVASKPKPSAAE